MYPHLLNSYTVTEIEKIYGASTTRETPFNTQQLNSYLNEIRIELITDHWTRCKTTFWTIQTEVRVLVGYEEHAVPHLISSQRHRYSVIDNVSFLEGCDGG